MFPRPLLIIAYLVPVLLLVFANIQITRIPKYSPPPLPTPSVKPNVSTDELSTLKAEIARLRSDQIQLKQVLSASTSGSSVSDYLTDSKKLIQINDRFSSIDVHELPLASAKIIGKLEASRSYPYSSKQSNWHQVQLEDGLFGWVQSELVIEP